ADHRQSCFGESAEQPLRQRSSFQPNSLEVVGEVLQHRQQRFRFARHLTSRTILPASSTMQMLVSLTETSSPAKWSMLRFSFCCLRPCSRTPFHHQPEAQTPNFPLSTSRQADYPIFRAQTGKTYARSVPYRFLPHRSVRSIHSTCLSALVPDRVMEAWYHPSIA